MRKLSQIEEGLWSKTFDRARTGEQRLGDKNKQREIAETFINTVYDDEEHIWDDFTRFMRMDELDDWGISDVLDRYESYDKFLDRCLTWIENTVGINDKEYREILEQ